MPFWPYATAAALAVFIGLVHSILGEWKLIGPLTHPAKRTGLLARSDFGRNVLRFAWHITTLAWWGMGAALLAAALAPPEQALRLAVIALAVTFLLTGLLILAVGRGRHLAWPVFLAIGGLGLYPLL